MESKGLESEAKYRLRPGQYEEVAKALSGYEHHRSVQEDQYYDVGGRVLRLRRENGSWFLTYKDKPQVTSQGVKVRHEVETRLPKEFAPELDALIVWLGHRHLTKVQKTRDTYHVDGLTVTLDRVNGLVDDYAELELLGNQPDGQPNGLKRMAKLRERLGLTDDQIELRSYAKLVAEARGEETHGRE
jgi:predicted adenylyl cyclase CyaB